MEPTLGESYQAPSNPVGTINSALRGSDRSGTPLLEAKNIRKSYAHVRALGGADFTVYPGEIVALIGDNGAGKSTLTKVLSGVVKPDSGEILIEGMRAELTGSGTALRHGIETVYQDLALATDLTPAENVFLGRELYRKGLLGTLGFLDRKTMGTETLTSLLGLGVKIKDMKAPVAALSGGQRQSVAVARAAKWAQKIIFMDEPTAALGVAQTAEVLDLIRRVAESGISVVLISHNMPDVLSVSDRIEVLRLGRRVAQFRTEDADVETLVAAMTSGTPEGTNR